MNKNTVIALVGVIVAMPLVYLLLNGIESEEGHSFRGVSITALAPESGTLIVPTTSENKQGAPLRANLKPAFMESVSGLKLPFAEPLDISIDSISKKIGNCLEDGTVPPQANFEVATSCAEATFKQLQLDRKTTLQIVPEEQMLMFGATSNNQIKLYHNGVIASYTSKDMTQGDRKREACIVRIMTDHILGRTATVESSCVTASAS